MAHLTRDDLIKACAAPLPCEPLEVPELGGAVVIRGMSGRERDVFEQSFTAARRRQVTVKNVRARLAAQCLIDADGQRLCTDADIETLGQLRADVLDRICAVAQRLSGFIVADLAELAKAAALGAVE